MVTQPRPRPRSGARGKNAMASSRLADDLLEQALQEGTRPFSRSQGKSLPATRMRPAVVVSPVPESASPPVCSLAPS
jgi:hypothetical protein